MTYERTMEVRQSIPSQRFVRASGGMLSVLGGGIMAPRAETEIQAQGRQQQQQVRVIENDPLRRRPVIYPDQFLRAVSDLVFNKQQLTDADINRGFGLSGSRFSLGPKLSGKEMRRFRAILSETGPVLIGAMLNSPIFEQAARIARGGGRNVVERVAQNLNDLDVQEKLKFHDFIHVSARFEQERELEPPFLTTLAEVNNVDLLKEEQMALLVGKFGNEPEPIIFMLMDVSKARAQRNRLSIAILKEERKRFSAGGRNLTKLNTLRVRWAIYDAAVKEAEKHGGILPPDVLFRFFHAEITEIFREVQQDTAARLLRTIHGNNISEGRIAAERVKVAEEYDKIMEHLRVEPDQRLMKRINQIHAAYKKGDRKVLYRVWAREMMDPLRKALNQSRRQRGLRQID